jgi:putative hemolysin
MIVEDRKTGTVVGTYRMQMGEVAGQYFGYYSEQEFCFAPYEAMRNQIVELGRACIHRDYRSSDVLHLLWRGIARYALVNGGRYMMGCCMRRCGIAWLGRSCAQWRLRRLPCRLLRR